jgi:RNA polymerase sigma-70 factor (ECF subfamily)
MARMFVNSHALAEEVVQETWLAVLEGIANFEGRSSLKTWLFQILANRARTKGVRESRYVSMENSVPAPYGEHNGNEVEWIHKVNHKKDQGDVAPRFQEEHTPYRLLLSKEIKAQIEKTIQCLPLKQRQVISLRDIEGFDSGSICTLLNITETNQRVLLHRARIKVRAEMTRYL